MAEGGHKVKRLFNILALLSVVGIIGTAGASDLDLINISQIAFRVLLFAILSIGFFLLAQRCEA